MTAPALPTRPLRQPVASGASRAPRGAAAASPQSMKRVPLFTDHGSSDDEFTMKLGDLPRSRPGLDVDGFQPTLASRFMDLVDRLRKR